MNSEKRTLRLISVKQSNSKRPKSMGDYVGDYADTFILLGSVLFTTASIVLAILIFLALARPTQPILGFGWMVELQRVIAATSLTISSAVMVVVGKRYAFSKLSGDGIHSQRIVLYSNPSITSLLGGIVQFRFEVLSLGLLAFWGLGFATGLTANHSFKLGFPMSSAEIGFRSGSLDGSQVVTVLGSKIASSFFNVIARASPRLRSSFMFLDDLGTIEVIDTLTTKGSIIYPPQVITGLDNFSALFYTSPGVLNGFQIAVQGPSENPDGNFSCNVNNDIQVWFVSADPQSLTLCIANWNTTGYNQYTATAVMMDGTLTGGKQYTQFVVNRTRPLTMSDTQWATSMVDVICDNTTAVFDFGLKINNLYQLEVTDSMIWTSVLSSIIGSYSAALHATPVSIKFEDDHDEIVLFLDYGLYVLIPNIVISIIMLVISWKLGRGSQLHPDFLNPTRILLDTSKSDDISLSNQSLGATEDALGNPCFQIIHNKDPELEVLLDANIPPREAPKPPSLSSSPSPYSASHFSHSCITF